MRLLTNKVILFTLLFSSIISFSSWAQFGNMNRNNAMMMANSYRNAKENGNSVKGYLSYSIGVGLPFTTAKFEHRFEDIKEDGTLIGESVIERNPKVSGLHLNTNVYYRLAELSENSILAFNFGVVAYLLNYDIGEIRLNEYQSYEYSMGSMQIGIPLCLDYKFGGEALHDKSQKTSLTLGIGMTPILYLNNFGNISSLIADVRPFLRAELGFFAGIEWRITGSLLSGTAKTMNIPKDDPNIFSMPSASSFTLTTSPIYSIGITLMPFSFDWDSLGW